MKKFSFYFLLSVVWLLMCVYAFSYVSSDINHDNLQTYEKIQEKQLNYHWPLESSDEVISSFRNHWNEVDGGIQADGVAPELSLDLAGITIDPSIHQSLSLQLLAAGNAVTNAKIKLEFSNQEQGIFYDSPRLEWSEFQHAFDLTTKAWFINDPTALDKKRHFMAWKDIGPLNALVIRFYFEQPTELIITDVVIQQSKKKQWQENHHLDCKSNQFTWGACYITNQMKYFEQQIYNNELDQQLYFSTFYNSMIWLLMAWVVCILVCFLQPVKDKSLVYLLISMVFGCIWVMHQAWVVNIYKSGQWLFLIGIGLLVWRYRSRSKWPDQSALFVWLISLMLALVLLIVSEFSLAFMYDLPQYLLWALVQQMILGPIVTQVIYKKLNTTKFMTAFWVGVLFSIIHAPNHVLMAATLVGGFAWSYVWLKYENLYANAFSHALLALVFYQAMPESWLGSARIGIFF